MLELEIDSTCVFNVNLFIIIDNHSVELEEYNRSHK